MAAAKYKNLFIVTYGRSGSTLLQGIVNSIDGYLIRGENGDFFGHLANAFEAVARAPHRKPGSKSTDATNPWYGIEKVDADQLLATFRRLGESVLLGDADPGQVRCLGFKEIRYNAEDVDLKLAFLAKLFPSAAFIINTRSLDDVLNSEWQRHVGRQKLEALEKKFESYRDRSNFFHITYEDIASFGGGVRAMFEFLGEPYDDAALRHVISRKHSYHTLETPIYSDFPAFVKPVGHDWVERLVVDQLRKAGRELTIAGIWISAGDQDIADVKSDNPQVTVHAVRTDIESPKIHSMLKSERSRQARYEVKMLLEGDVDSFGLTVSGELVLQFLNLGKFER